MGKPMKIFYIKEGKIIEANRDDFNYRHCIPTPKGIRPEVFFEDGIVKYWAGDKIKNVENCTKEENLAHWERVLSVEFEKWANQNDLDFYYDLENAKERLTQMNDG